MKDIKEIIHLYIGQEVWETFNNRKAKLVGVIQGDKMPVKCLWHDKADWAFDYDEVKLILRRLSSMTNSEKLEVCIINPKLDDNQIAAARTVYLLSKGFWIFDESAFDQGIIIDRDSQLN